MKEVFQTKRESALRHFGAQLSNQRTKVFKESLENFAMRLRDHWGISECDAEMVSRMESGDPDIKITDWLSVWMACQVLDPVMQAVKSDAALFLAAIEHPANIESEILDDIAARRSK